MYAPSSSHQCMHHRPISLSLSLELRSIASLPRGQQSIDPSLFAISCAGQSHSERSQSEDSMLSRIITHMNDTDGRWCIHNDSIDVDTYISILHLSLLSHPLFHLCFNNQSISSIIHPTIDLCYISTSSFRITTIEVC